MKRSRLHLLVSLSPCLLVFLLPACTSHYTTPGRPADMSAFGLPAAAESRDSLTNPSIQTNLNLQPLATFPVTIAIVRAQAPGYRSYSCESYGTGAYSIVTARDVESDESLKKISRLPLITAVAPINRMLLPNQLNSDLELRNAAALLHADLLLIYTLDTQFSDKDALPPLSVITLGLAPTTVAKVNSTASAVLLDTRNGYVYALAEASAKADRLANSWNSSSTLDAARKQSESEAFDKLVDQFSTAWSTVLNQYALHPQPTPQRAVYPQPHRGPTILTPHGDRYETARD